MTNSKIENRKSKIVTVGIDPGLTATGWATPDGLSGVIESKLLGVARLDDIARRVVQLLNGGGPVVLVAIEGYSFGARQMAHQMGELGGVLRLMMWRNDVPFVDVAPTALKKFAGERGNLKKDEVRLAVFKRWGREFKTEHEVDAFVLAKIGQEVARDSGLAVRGSGEARMTKAQKEIIQKLQGQVVTFNSQFSVGGRNGHTRSLPDPGTDASARPRRPRVTV